MMNDTGGRNKMKSYQEMSKEEYEIEQKKLQKKLNQYVKIRD